MSTNICLTSCSLIGFSRGLGRSSGLKLSGRDRVGLDGTAACSKVSSHVAHEGFGGRCRDLDTFVRHHPHIGVNPKFTMIAHKGSISKPIWGQQMRAAFPSMLLVSVIAMSNSVWSADLPLRLKPAIHREDAMTPAERRQLFELFLEYLRQRRAPTEL